jgi:hypothetical protein
MRRMTFAVPALLALSLPLGALGQGVGGSPYANPGVDQRLQEMRGASPAPDQGAPLARQERSAAQLDGSQADVSQADVSQAGDDAGSLLRMAEQALGQGQWSRANEYLERASTRLLTRSAVASQAGVPVEGGAVGAIAAAREALGRRDRSEAGRQIAEAQGLTRDSMARDSMTGSSSGAGPGVTGGGGGAPKAPDTKPVPLR